MPLGKTVVFFLLWFRSHRDIVGRIRRIRFMPQSHKVKNISPSCEATTAEMENESEAPFSLNSIEPLTFSDFKS